MEDESAVPPEVSLAEHISSPQVVELAADWLELPLDQMLHAADDIPILGTLLGLGRAGLRVRDYLFARKLLTFYSELARTSPAQREKFVGTLRDEGRLGRTGEMLLELLDKAHTSEKAQLLGRLFARCIEQGTLWSDCERMSEMVTAAYMDDVRYFLSTEPAAVGETGDEVEHLIALGFYTRQMKAFGPTVMAGIQPILTTYGEFLRAALRG